MDKIVYCYIDKRIKKDRFRTFAEEFAYSKSQENVCYYNKDVDAFFDKDGRLFSVAGKRILMRAFIEDRDAILASIERDGGIPVNTKQDIDRILNWKKEIPVHHSHLIVKGKEILENEEIKSKIVELSNDKGFFFKTVEKDFSGIIPTEELFDPSRGFLPALELHRETDFVISEALDILSDAYGKLEFRCFVVDGKILNISRNLFCTYHYIEPMVWEQANHILSRIQKIADFPTTFAMDIMVASSSIKSNIYIYDILELNPLEGTGAYLYNTVWENSISYTENKSADCELITEKDEQKRRMQDYTPIYKIQKILGFTKGFEPSVTMKQCYYKDEFSYHYECAKKFGNPNMERFWTHSYFSDGSGASYDIIDVLNDNISLKKVLASGQLFLESCGADLEYMNQQLKLEEKQTIEGQLLDKPLSRNRKI